MSTLPGDVLWGGGTGDSEGATPAQTSVLEMIDDALRISGVTQGPGRTPGSDQRDDAFRQLKLMLNRWRTQRLAIRGVVRSLQALVSGTAEYTIGTGATFDIGRPSKIERAGLVDSSAFEWPLAVLTDQHWAGVTGKSLSGIPWGIWYERAVPSGIIHVVDVPSGSGYQLALYLWLQIADLASKNDFVDLPDSYQDAIVWNLAEVLVTRFKPQLTPAERDDIHRQARESKASIESINNPAPPVMTSDAPGSNALGRRRGRFDYRTGRNW